MGVGESVYYHCTSREGGYAIHTQFTDSPPLQTPCGPHSVAPPLISLSFPLVLSCIHASYTGSDPSTPAL